MGTKISALPPVTTMVDADLVPYDQAGTTSVGTGLIIKTYCSLSPTLVTPNLGTPSAGVLTNATGLPEGGLSLTDITTNNASSTKHGFLPKLSNSATDFLNGTGAWAVPAGGGTVTHTGNLTANAIVLGNAVADVKPMASLGTTTTVLHGNAAGAPTFGAVDLAADVTGVLPFLINAQTGTSYTIIAGDQGKIVTFANTAAVAVTLPQATGSFTTGWSTSVENKGSGLVTITPTTSTIDGDTALILPPGSGFTLASDGTNYTSIRGLASSTVLVVPVVDGQYSGPVTRAFNSGYSSTTIGDLMILDSSATWQKTDANTAALYDGMLGIALSVAASGAAPLVALPGCFVYATAFPTFTVGGTVYMSETAAAVTQTKPTTTDAATRVVGFAVHADKLFFFPSPDYITHT